LDNLGEELAYAKEREKMVLTNFGELTKINNNLQGRLGEISGVEDPDRKRAEELMRKMEIIVAPAPEPETKAQDTQDAE